MKISKNDVIDFLKESGKWVGVLALKVYGESLNQVGAQAFSEAIELGIENTLASLYDAKVSDKEIIRVISEHWGVSYREAEDRLVREKQQAVIRSLRQYLKLQGYSSDEIHDFMFRSQAAIRIKHEKELWKLKDAPEKLFKILQNSN